MAGAPVGLGAIAATAGGWAKTGGGEGLTRARCNTCGATATIAAATGAEAASTRAGTTVAAARLANCWRNTCGGGSALAGRAATIVFKVVTLTLVMLMLRI
jgi:hypothetical protein